MFAVRHGARIAVRHGARFAERHGARFAVVEGHGRGSRAGSLISP